MLGTFKVNQGNPPTWNACRIQRGIVRLRVEFALLLHYSPINEEEEIGRFFNMKICRRPHRGHNRTTVSSRQESNVESPCPLSTSFPNCSSSPRIVSCRRRLRWRRRRKRENHPTVSSSSSSSSSFSSSDPESARPSSSRPFRRTMCHPGAGGQSRAEQSRARGRGELVRWRYQVRNLRLRDEGEGECEGGEVEGRAWQTGHSFSLNSALTTRPQSAFGSRAGKQPRRPAGTWSTGPLS